MEFEQSGMNMSRLGQFGRLGTWCALLAAGLWLAGCKSGPDPRFSDLTETGAATSPEEVSGSGFKEANVDVIHEGDALIITFADLPYLQPNVEDRVKQDGTITLLQNQTFKAAGKTRSQLEKEIRNTYVPKFFKAMTVTVKLTENTRFYYVGGEVKRPDRQVYLARITVLKAIQSAGDFTDFARKSKVVLTRANGTRFVIDCPKAQEDPNLDLEVYPGDKIYVPRRLF